MKMFKTHSDAHVVNQNVDTLEIAYTCLDEHVYNTLYREKIDLLEELKASAQSIRGFNDNLRFVRSDLDINLGEFFVFSKGVGRYAYHIKNNDIDIYLYNSNYSTDFPHIKVTFRAEFLFALGHVKAVATVEKIVKKLIGDKYKRIVARLDLATDVAGISYNMFDRFRFQTNYKNYDYTDRLYARFNKVQTFYFGNSSFLFRIYNKTDEIKKKISKSFVVKKWLFNDYNTSDDTLQVWRHELQLRRETLKKYVPKTIDEVDYIFAHLQDFWSLVFKKISHTELTQAEIIRIQSNTLKQDSIKKIFYRAKNDSKRENLFFDILSHWDNKFSSQLLQFKDFQDAKKENVKRALKTYVTIALKNSFGDKHIFKDIFKETNRDILNQFGIDIFEYTELKVATSLVKSIDFIDKYNIAPRISERFLLENVVA